MTEERTLQEIREAGERSATDLVLAIEAYCERTERIRFYDYDVNRILETCVEQTPNAFLPLADRINQIGVGEVISGLGYGLRKAVTANVIDNPRDVATLLQRVAQQLDSGELEFAKPEAHWPSHAYVDLLREASRQVGKWREVEVHQMLLDAARLFIGVAGAKSGMIVERQFDGGSDWIAHSLNSDHGLLGYAVCYLSSVAAEENDARKLEAQEWREQEANAFKLLEVILAKPEPNYLRVAFGSLIPFMLIRRPDWFGSHRDIIFPNDAVLWEASWSSYIMPRQRWDKVFFALESEYIRSINRTQELLTSGVDIGDGEWHRIPGEDAALFWQNGTIQGDNRVLRFLIDQAPDVLLDDMVDVLRHTIEKDKATPDRAAELVKLIQDVRGDDRQGSISYWTRLQILFDHVPAHYWLGELRPSFDNCIAVADQIYVDLHHFLDTAFAIDSEQTTNILVQIRERANQVPWFFMWSRVRPLLDDWRGRVPPGQQAVIDLVLKTNRAHD